MVRQSRVRAVGETERYVEVRFQDPEEYTHDTIEVE